MAGRGWNRQTLARGELRSRGVLGGRLGVVLAGALAGLATAAPASALQPIGTFLERADAQNPDNREALATVAQRNAEATTAFRRLLPAFTARGTYTHNQYEVAFALPGSTQAITLVPGNQFDAVFQLDVPIFDPAGYGRYRAATAQASATQASQALTRLGVQQQVVSIYNQIIGAEALVASSKRSVEAAQRNVAVVRDRRTAGLVSDFDVQRATANVERARQDLADAELTESLSRRNLETLTGITPLPSESQQEDDLREEAPLAAWLSSTPGSSLPAGRAAAAQTRAAEAGRSAAKLALLPSVTASAQERISNAASFGGQNAYYTLTATATWRFDLSLLPAISAQDAAVAAARAREDKTTRSAEDAVFDAWQRVHAGIAKSRAARAQAAAAAQAAKLAEDRYASGAATQLEVIEAQRDAFTAETLRVTADAGLGASRLLLRINAGRPAAETAPKNP
jgi:outer membrane protein TolC